MLKIVNYSERTAEDGKTFFTLTVQGGIEMVKSQSTGNFYATARKSSIPCTFNEETCKALMGTDMPGKIEKEQCKPYEYTIKDTGEVITLSHRYVYVPEGEKLQSKENHNAFTANVSTVSSNGVLEPAG